MLPKKEGDEPSLSEAVRVSETAAGLSKLYRALEGKMASLMELSETDLVKVAAQNETTWGAYFGHLLEALDGCLVATDHVFTQEQVVILKEVIHAVARGENNSFSDVIENEVASVYPNFTQNAHTYSAFCEWLGQMKNIGLHERRSNQGVVKWLMGTILTNLGIFLSNGGWDSDWEQTNPELPLLIAQIGVALTTLMRHQAQVGSDASDTTVLSQANDETGVAYDYRLERAHRLAKVLVDENE